MKPGLLLLAMMLALVSGAVAAPALCPPVSGSADTTGTLQRLLGLSGTEPVTIVKRLKYPDARSEESLTLADGLIVHFTFAKPQAPEADTVILLHEMGTSRHDWDAMGKALVEAGFGVIAPDLRGCGESMQKTDGTMVTAATFDHLAVPNPWEKLVDHVFPLIEWAKTAHRLTEGRFSVMGSVLGASVGGLALSSKPLELSSAVLLSPQPVYYNLDLYKGIREIQGRPVLLVLGSHEDYVKERVNRLKGSCKSATEFMVKTESGEGVRLLTAEAMERVITFYEDQRGATLSSLAKIKAEATPRPTPVPTKVAPRVGSQIVGHRKIKLTPSPSPTPTATRRPAPA